MQKTKLSGDHASFYREGNMVNYFPLFVNGKGMVTAEVLGEISHVEGKRSDLCYMQVFLIVILVHGCTQYTQQFLLMLN